MKESGRVRTLRAPLADTPTWPMPVAFWRSGKWPCRTSQVAVWRLLIGMRSEKTRDLGFNGLGEQRTCALPRHLGQRIANSPGCARLMIVSWKHGESLLRWRSGGLTTTSRVLYLEAHVNDLRHQRDILLNHAWTRLGRKLHLLKIHIDVKTRAVLRLIRK